MAELPDDSPFAIAYGLIHGPRQQSYGHPLDDFTRAGRMWGAILGIEDVSAENVALCLGAVKISREVNAHKADNVIDGMGYWGCYELVRQERARRENVTPDH